MAAFVVQSGKLVQATPGSACLDVVYEGPALELPVGRVIKVSTGLRIQIPEGWCLKVEGRSGHATKGVTVLAGRIDADYLEPDGVTGREICVLMFNLGPDVQYVESGTRIAQLKEEMSTNIGDWIGVYEGGIQRTGGFGSTNSGHGDQTIVS